MWILGLLFWVIIINILTGGRYRENKSVNPHRVVCPNCKYEMVGKSTGGQWTIGVCGKCNHIFQYWFT